jgi:hypothetical protein
MPNVKVLAALFDGPDLETILARVDGSLHFLVRRNGWALDGEALPDFMVDSAVAKYGFEPVEPAVEVDVLQLSDLEEGIHEIIKPPGATPDGGEQPQ